MTIHHDKMAYGRLARTSEELSDEDILKMLSKLSDGEGGDSNSDENPEEGGSDSNENPDKEGDLRAVKNHKKSAGADKKD